MPQNYPLFVHLPYTMPSRGRTPSWLGAKDASKLVEQLVTNRTFAPAHLFPDALQQGKDLFVVEPDAQLLRLLPPTEGARAETLEHAAPAASLVRAIGVE